MDYLHNPSASTMAPRWEPPRRAGYRGGDDSSCRRSTPRAKGALLVDLLLVESSPPRYFALLVGSRLVDVPLRDTHGRDRRVTNSSSTCTASHQQGERLLVERGDIPVLSNRLTIVDRPRSRSTLVYYSLCYRPQIERIAQRAFVWKSEDEPILRRSLQTDFTGGAAAFNVR